VVARVFARAADQPVRSRTRMVCALALGYFYANKSAAAPFAALRHLVFLELALQDSTVGPSVLSLAVFQAVLVLTLVDLSVRVAVLAFSVEEVIPVLTCSQLKRTHGVEKGKSSAIYLEQRGGGGPEDEVGKCVIKEGRTAGWKSS
jgi:hypothetical protein